MFTYHHGSLEGRRGQEVSVKGVSLGNPGTQNRCGRAGYLCYREEDCFGTFPLIYFELSHSLEHCSLGIMLQSNSRTQCVCNPIGEKVSLYKYKKKKNSIKTMR